MAGISHSVIIIQIILLSIQAILYFGIQIFEGTAHDVYSRADDRIPFVPQMIFIYILWFPLIAIFPLLLYQASFDIYLRHMIALVLDILFSCVIYLVYPTSFVRPEPEPTGIGRFMRFVYLVDFKGNNCMPSMHCSMCFLMIFSSAALMSVMPIYMAVAVIVLCLLIVATTVLTKQHVVIDVVAGFGMAVVCWLLASPIGFLVEK